MTAYGLAISFLLTVLTVTVLISMFSEHLLHDLIPLI